MKVIKLDVCLFADSIKAKPEGFSLYEIRIIDQSNDLSDYDFERFSIVRTNICTSFNRSGLCKNNLVENFATVYFECSALRLSTFSADDRTLAAAYAIRFPDVSPIPDSEPIYRNRVGIWRFSFIDLAVTL